MPSEQECLNNLTAGRSADFPFMLSHRGGLTKRTPVRQHAGYFVVMSDRFSPKRALSKSDRFVWLLPQVVYNGYSSNVLASV
jgi:hypothetical protein